ncbi:MAG: hypothetical protein JSS27_02535 [Planctomycetes bacterium]|nr:hypothetical protein [Planctomycetota bacterium]
MNTIQKLSFDHDANSGGLGLSAGTTTIGMSPTGSLASNQAALDALLGSGNSLLAGDWSPAGGLTIELTGAFANGNVPLLAITNDGLALVETAPHVWDGALHTDFADGATPAAAAPATFTVTPTDTIGAGSWTIDDWTGGVNDTPAPSHWTLVSGANFAAASSSSGSLVFQSNGTGSGQSPPTFNDSSTLHPDSSPPISFASTSFADGADAVTGAPATCVISLDSAGSASPDAGHWSLGDWTGAIGDAPAPGGWTSGGGTLVDILSGATVNLTRTTDGAGQSAPALVTSTLTYTATNTTPVDVNFATVQVGAAPPGGNLAQHQLISAGAW